VKEKYPMDYHPLNEKTILDYLKSRPNMKAMLASDGEFSVKEVGDGNLNLVFILESIQYPEVSFVLKQALPYLRVVGDSWPLTRERMRFEAGALQLYNELTPGLAPAVYDYDEEMSAVMMEYLGKHEVMRKPLVARKRFPLFVDHISTFLARTLFFTSDLYLSGPQKKELQKKFINPELCKIQEDFVFTNPYMESVENHWNPVLDAEVKAVRSNAPLKIAFAEIKETYMAHSQALIHSDLHTGSIMVNQDETKVIDPEFSFFGPIGYDIGALLANLVINYLAHFAHTPDPEERAAFQSYLLQTAREIWLEFARKFETLWVENNCGELAPNKYWDFPGGQEAFAEFRRRYIQDIFDEMVGHAACKILRRMMGIVSVWDISCIQDLEKRAIPERLAIQIGTRWGLERRRIKTIDDFLGIVGEVTENVPV
jgi:5-methylthioribose kinase